MGGGGRRWLSFRPNYPSRCGTVGVNATNCGDPMPNSPLFGRRVLSALMLLLRRRLPALPMDERRMFIFADTLTCCCRSCAISGLSITRRSSGLAVAVLVVVAAATAVRRLAAVPVARIGVRDVESGCAAGGVHSISCAVAPATSCAAVAAAGLMAVVGVTAAGTESLVAAAAATTAAAAAAARRWLCGAVCGGWR